MNDLIKVHAGEEWINGWPIGGESLWAERISPKRARIDNVPFFTARLALNDIVEIDAEGEIVRLVKAGPFSHFVLVKADDIELQRVLDAVHAFLPDAHCEGGFDTLLVVDTDAPDTLVSLARLMKRQGLLRGWEQTR